MVADIDPDVQKALQNPEGFQQEALGYLGELFEKAAETHPVFIQVEDLHWADDRSMDLLNNLTRENQKLPLFIIYMTRPSVFERRPSWGEGQLTTLTGSRPQSLKVSKIDQEQALRV